LATIAQEQEIAEKNKALESEIKQKEQLYKALHEKEKKMLSFFTHTMRNALATAPESLRQAIHLLGGEVYEQDTKHYQAINKIAALFSTLSLTDCLIDTFKQSISDPQEFRQAWQQDHTGEATPIWVIASALRQSLNRIIFMSDTTELRKLLDNPETALIKATRKSFIEEVLPLNVDQHGVEIFYHWTHAHISALEVSITGCDKLNFGVNQIRFSLLFAITSELILNALKYWDGENRIHISWQLTAENNHVFSIKNHCQAHATSNLAGTHKGLAFIKRLVELLGDQAQFSCKSEDQLFTAELILNSTLFDGGS
jgi:two-component sensor histidine kinase